MSKTHFVVIDVSGKRKYFYPCSSVNLNDEGVLLAIVVLHCISVDKLALFQTVECCSDKSSWYMNRTTILKDT